MKPFQIIAIALMTLAAALPGRAVTINVTYTDGASEGFFDATLGAARRSAFEAAASQWSQTLGGTVPIEISASFDNLGGETNGSAVLGSAGPTFFFENFTGAPQADTFMAMTLANQFAGGDLDPGSEEIVAQFNNQVDTSAVFGATGFYYGTDLNAGSNIDFYTVVLHEIGHGLGFLDGMSTNGSFGFGHPSVWDRHLANGSAAAATTFPSLTQTQRQAALISGSLFFSGTNTRAANGNLNAEIYAPNPFEGGSSASHLDETVFSPAPDGTAGSTVEELMTPLNSADTHTIGPILIGILKDLGWTATLIPAVTISDLTIAEGNSGTKTATLTVTLSSASAQTVTVQFATANGSATAGTDYTATSGTLTFTAGQTSKTISITLTGDTKVESDETILVNLSNATNANLADLQGVVLISNDDVNAAPVNGTLTSTTASDAANVTRIFATTYSDANGASDFAYMMLHINTSTSAISALRCQYNPVNNKLYVRNDANTGWLGGFLAGSNNTISNSQGSLDCAQTSVVTNGNTVTIQWAVRSNGTWAGIAVNTYLFSKDSAGAQDGYDQKGTWTITGNVAPVNVSLSPSATTSIPAEEKVLTAVYSDANGNGNLSQCILRVGSGTADGFRALYNPGTNKLSLLDDAGTTYLGGIAPGGAGSVSNARGTLNFAATTISRVGNNVTVNWRVSLKNTDWTGTNKPLTLLCKDKAGLSSGFVNFGSWTLNLASPLAAGEEPSQ